ncbi:MAG: hypothetical protein IKS00_07880 [Bacteroidales bacterium]|nr:hypothetical protein [Bacteroidales bacterium]
MMRRFLLLIAAVAAAVQGIRAQSSFDAMNVEKFYFKVNTSNVVAKKISAAWQRQADALAEENRGAFFDGLFAVTRTAATGVLGQSAGAIVSASINTIKEKIKSRKADWEQLVQRESFYEKRISMLSNIDDFYSTVSDAGALDPSGMSFNGFTCLQQRGRDTVFYFSCSLDTAQSSLVRILRHSKFQLRLDTLIFKPALCNLPNDPTRAFSERKSYSFSERGSISLALEFEISSSWINQAIQVHDDVELGKFTVNVPVSKESLDSDGRFVYIGGKSTESEQIQILGDCFIVPRSYIGVRDVQGVYHDAWGTGQYKASLVIRESCGVTPVFADNWKDDWKSRPKKSTLKQDLLQTVNQVWNTSSKAWICTLTQAPVSYTKQQVLSALGITQPVSPQ